MILLLLTSCRLFSDYVFEDELDTGPVDVRAPYEGSLSTFGSGLPIEGVEVCVFTEPTVPCASTDSSGLFIMDRPRNGLIALSMEHPEYQPTLLHFEMRDDTQPLSYQLLTTALRDQVVAELTPTPDLDLAIILGSGIQLGGATGDLSPALGEGPVYPNEFGDPTGNTTVVADVALWYSVPAGTYDVALTHPDKACVAADQAWPAGTERAARLEALGGWMSTVDGFRCESDTKQ